MDTLAGYGSDSSSSSTGEKTTAAEPQKALANLVGGYFEDDSSSEEGSLDTGAKGAGSDNEQTESSRRQAKRRRREHDGTSANVDDDGLPVPPVGSESMVFWNTDYIKAMKMRPAESGRSKDSRRVLEPSDDLRQLSKTYTSSSTQSKVGLAAQLKLQHEFHNPSFFNKVVKHFGIRTPLQRQCRSFPISSSSPTAGTSEGGQIPDWEYRLAGLPTLSEQEAASLEN